MYVNVLTKPSTYYLYYSNLCHLFRHLISTKSWVLRYVVKWKRGKRPLLIFTLEGRILPSFTYNAMPIALAISLDKSTDSDTESETDPNHPSFRKSRRQRPMFRLIYAHNTPHRPSISFPRKFFVFNRLSSRVGWLHGKGGEASWQCSQKNEHLPPIPCERAWKTVQESLIEFWPILSP